MADPAPAPAPSRPILSFLANLFSILVPVIEQELPILIQGLLSPNAVSPAAGPNSGAVTLARKPCCGDAAPAPADLNAMAQAVVTTVGQLVADTNTLATDQTTLATVQAAVATDANNVAADQTNALAALAALQTALSPAPAPAPSA